MTRSQLDALKEFVRASVAAAQPGNPEDSNASAFECAGISESIRLAAAEEQLDREFHDGGK